MVITELREKYKKAHETYLKYKDTNHTNNIEQQYMPEILSLLPLKHLYTTPDCFLNYLGVDLIDLDTGKTFDVKICRHLTGTQVMIDAYKKGYKAVDCKINDYFVFLNSTNCIVATSDTISRLIPPETECFYLKRDLYQTTKKAIVDLKDVKKVVIPRR